MTDFIMFIFFKVSKVRSGIQGILMIYASVLSNIKIINKPILKAGNL